MTGPKAVILRTSTLHGSTAKVARVMAHKLLAGQLLAQGMRPRVLGGQGRADAQPGAGEPDGDESGAGPIGGGTLGLGGVDGG